MSKFLIELISNLIEKKYHYKSNSPRIGRPLIHPIKKCVEKIFNVLRTGQQWKALGEGYSTYHKRFVQWSNDGIFEEAFHSLQRITKFSNEMKTYFAIDSCILRNK